MQGDEKLQLLLDTRNLSNEAFINITTALVQRGISPTRFVVPSPSSYGRISVVQPDGSVKTYWWSE